jgi:hypothetical protein
MAWITIDEQYPDYTVTFEGKPSNTSFEVQLTPAQIRLVRHYNRIRSQYETMCSELVNHVKANKTRSQYQTTCSHKFIDSKRCVKCGWIPPYCNEPDLNDPDFICGEPLPCPHHTQKT